MDTEEFRKHGKEMVDYICDYMDNIHLRRVTPDVQPGYIRQMLPSRAPKHGEQWPDIMKDIERAIMPGVRLTELLFSCICVSMMERRLKHFSTFSFPARSKQKPYLLKLMCRFSRE